jgi:predicted membrane-bound spermidine synthase
MLTTYLGVALIAMATLLLELAMTRIFSVVLFYHFAFMVISLALFGIGAGGVYVYVRPRKFTRDRLRGQLATFAGLFALSAVFSIWYVLWARFTPESHPSWEVTLNLQNVWQLARLYLVSTLPFFFSGVAIALAVFHLRERIGTVYFFDLTGAAIGCLLMPLFVTAWGGPHSVVAAAGIGVLAALAVEVREPFGPFRWRVPWRALVALVALAVIVPVGQSRGWFDVRSVKDVDGDRLVFSKWNAHSWVTVEQGYDGQHTLRIDASAAARIYSAGTIETHNEARAIAALAYAIRRGELAKVLIIGPGGGVDIVSALYHGSRNVVAVEINPIIVNDVMLGRFREQTGSLFAAPGVRVVQDEGRSFIRRSPYRFDVIQATLVDTWAATSAGAYSLTENTLYTVEAFRDYLGHLTPGGILSMSRWRTELDSEFIRLISLARAALAEEGIREARRHLFAAQHGRLATLLLGRAPFTDEEVRALEGVCAERDFRVLFSPLTPHEGDVATLATTADPEAFYRDYPFDIRPVTDDNPFFFYSPSKAGLLSSLGDGTGLREEFAPLVLVALTAIVLLLVLLFIALPLLILRRQALAQNRGGKLLLLAYFICLGLGFIVVEIGMLQKLVVFLGHPSHALIVVLFSLLLASGCGSWLSGRLAEDNLVRRFVVVGLCLVGIVALYALVLGWLVDLLIPASLPWRIAVSVLLVVLPGVLMGMMVPLGVRFARQCGWADLIPWGWGMNGACSVLGSVLAMIIAIGWGLQATLACGALVYLLGLGPMALAVRRGRASAT